MTFTGALGMVVLIILTIAILGPAKLPAAIEQIWLTLMNFRRQQAEQPPLTLEQARRSWEATQNPIYALVQVLYGSVEHLVELRRRIFMVLGAALAGAIAASLFTNPIIDFLTRPRGDVQLIFTAPTDMVLVYIEIILSVAAIVSLPVLFWQILMFIRPALETQQEISAFRAIAIFGMPLVGVFFVGGLAFAYFVLLPFALQYLAGFGGGIAKPTWTIRSYYSFVINVLVWVGAAFETPLVMTVLARLGLVSPSAMAKRWRYAIVVTAIVAAIITPTVDPFNMALVMLPLCILYFLGIAMARVAYRPRDNTNLSTEQSLSATK